MTTTQQILTIGIMAAAVVATRFLPFLLFPNASHTPQFVRYLGKYLAPAVFGMLVVYCLKDIHILQHGHGLPQVLGVGCCVALHLWRRNMLLTIAGGTLFYMFLIQYTPFG